MNHGHRTTYRKGCRCDECRKANRDYQKSLARRHAHIAYDAAAAFMVDATPIRLHIKQLRASGMGRRQIAKASGVSETIIMRLIGLNTDRPAKRVRKETAEKILALQPGTLAPHGMTTSLGTIRRLQALIAIGYSQYHLAEMLGTTNSHIGLLLTRQDRVLSKTAKAVADLYSKLELTPGPSNRARLYAERRGWHKPLDWNDPDTDAEPVRIIEDKSYVDQVKIDLVRSGEKHKLTRAETIYAVRLWRDEGLSFNQIDELLGNSSSTAVKLYNRHADRKSA